MNTYAYIYMMLVDIMGADNVYNLTPMKEVPYPFAVMGDETNDIMDTKTTGIGIVSASFDLWGKNRAELHQIANQARTWLDKQGATGLEVVTIKDTSTPELLWHINFNFKIKEF